MIKRFSMLWITTMILLVVIPASVMAQTVDTVSFQPYWTNASRVDAKLTFSGTTANCYTEIGAYAGTTNISGTLKLERKNTNGTYTEVKSWSVSSSSQTLTASQTQLVTSGYTYRLTISAKVTRNGVSETVSSSMEKALN